KVLIPSLNKLQKEIVALQNTIKRLGKHPKMNAAILGRLRAKLQALKAERTELISLINDVSAKIKEISDALALQTDTGQDTTSDNTPTLTEQQFDSGGSGSDSAAAAAQTQ